MISEIYRPISLTDIVPNSRQKILGIEPITHTTDEKYIDHERFRQKAPILAYSQKEERIAQRSLWNHIGVTYTGVAKRSNPMKALEVVYDTLFEVSDDFIVRPHNVIDSLREFRELSNSAEELRRHHAPIITIAYFLEAQAHRSGETKQVHQLYWYYQASALSDVEFQDYFSDALQSYQYRVMFWRQELDSIKEHPVVLDLLVAIRDAEH